MSFLNLPYHVRRKVYILAGAVRLCPINCSREHRRHVLRKDMLYQYRHDLQTGLKTEADLCLWTCDYQIRAFSYGRLSPAEEDEDECMCPPLPISLLRTCRQVYEDLSSLIYSENKFKLVFNAPVQLPRHALAKMTSLTVRLTWRYCVSAESCKRPKLNSTSENESFTRNDISQLCEPCKQARSAQGDLSLDDRSTSTQEVVEKWKSFCKEYGSLLRPQLRFTLIANCTDIVTNQEIVSATESFSRLDHCTIRLSDSPNADLREIAEKSVFRITHEADAKQSPFRFLDLPTELQREVLLHTDLVCPSYMTIWWKPKRNTLFQAFTTTLDDQARLKACCTDCSDSLDRCCCVTRYANASSRQCKCWRFPLALSRTCRKLRDLATEVFYSSNKFMLRCGLPDARNGRLEILCPTSVEYFLNLSPPLVLESIRWLRLVWTKSAKFFLEEDEKAAHSLQLARWHSVMQSFASKVGKTSRITIELDFEFVEYITRRFGPFNEPIDELHDPRWEQWEKVAGLFHFGDGLKDFFVYAGRGASSERERCHDFERKLERRVMGPDYDSVARGKYTQRLPPMNACFLQKHFAKPVYAPNGTKVFPPERLRPLLEPDSLDGKSTHWVC